METVELTPYKLRPNCPSGGYMPKGQRLHAKTAEIICQHIVQYCAIRQMALPPSPKSPRALQIIKADRIYYSCFVFMWMFVLLEYASEYTVISVNMPTPHFYRKYTHPFSEGIFLKILW